MRSIRKELTIGLAKGLLLISVICGAVLYVGVRGALTRQFDESLLGKARAFAVLSDRTSEEIEGVRVALAAVPDPARTTIDQKAGSAKITEVEQIIRDGRVYYKVECLREGVESEFLVSGTGGYLGLNDEYGFAFHEAALPEFQRSDRSEYYQVWDEDREVVAKSPSLDEATLPAPQVVGGSPVFRNAELPDGRPGRIVALRFRPRLSVSGESAPLDNEELVIAMARSRGDLDEALRVLMVGMVLSGFLLVGGAAWVVRRTVARELAPLNALAHQATAIDAGNLTDRFPAKGLPDELTPITMRLNELLGRLETAFLREKRFTSDVAHELRTPIAELRTLAEVGLRSGEIQDGHEDREAYLSDVLAIATQMDHLVAALLTLARCASGQYEVSHERVDLAAVVAEAWRPLAAEAGEHGLRTEFLVPAQTAVRTDRTLLSAIVVNLLANVEHYTPRDGTVTVELVVHESQAALRVTNTNVHLDAADLPRLIEPFWRKDPARSDTSHSGIGLAVVAAFAKLLELDLSMDLPAPDRFSVTVAGLRMPRD